MHRPDHPLERSRALARRRQANESIARGTAGSDAGPGAFVCECGDGNCSCTIDLTFAEYELVRAHATHFAIARDHENPESERVVEENERFAVIEMAGGEATKLARRSDPRAAA